MVMEDQTTTKTSLLLEYASSNDVVSFKHLVEIENAVIDSTAPWYGPLIGSPSTKLAVADRTPLMIAALYGSLDVIAYIIDNHRRNPSVDFDRRSESDGATALRLAYAGGSSSSDAAVKLLLSVTSPDAYVDSPVNGSSLKKKKEYPVDLTLPDIKNGIYGSDEFRIYSFKVKPCSRAYSHDWTECPFVHPGENARRRDPRKYAYSCVPCPEFRKGSCRNGDGCEYAHGVFESWLHPMQYRTRLCKDEVGCNRRVCFFAHKAEELRSVNPMEGSGFHNSMASLTPPSPGAAWMNQAASPVSGRSKTSLDIDFELLAQRKLLEQLQSAASSPRANYNNILGSQFMNQGLTQQLISGYNNGNLQIPSSSVLNASTSHGFDNSLAKAIMNARSAAFAKRSQSFIDREPVSRFPTTTMGLSNWGSPGGNLDWGIQGEELNKFRKSASFAIRNNHNVHDEEPDLSWVQSLVKDGREEQMVA